MGQYADQPLGAGPSDNNEQVGPEPWFGKVSIGNAPEQAQDCVAELTRMLDHVRPSRLDRARSYVVDSDHGWELPIEVLLAHADGEDSDVTLVIGEKEAIVAWLTAHEHVDAMDGDDERPWTTVVVDLVAAVLRGEYEVEDTLKWGRLMKSKVIDRLEDRTLSTTGSLLGLLIPTRVAQVERHRLDFGCSR